MSESDFSRRIRDLRAQHNLTLDQIAQAVGVGKSTVRKWETGMIENMRRDKIAKLAAALHTTPAYLMGWEEPDDQPPVATLQPAPEPLSDEDRELLRKFHCLDARGQSAVWNVINYEYNALPGSTADAVPKEA